METIGGRDETVQLQLKSVMRGCCIIQVDPALCIRLLLSRDISRNIQRKLNEVITGRLALRTKALPGLVSGTPTSIVVLLTENLEYMVVDFLSRDGM